MKISVKEPVAVLAVDSLVTNQSSQITLKAEYFCHLRLDDGPLLLDVAGANEELGHLGDGQHLHTESRHHARLEHRLCL